MDLSNLKNLNNLKSMNNESLDTSYILNSRIKTITGNRFYVSEGILKCNNYFISLDSICMVEISIRQDTSLFFRLLVLSGGISGLVLLPLGIGGFVIGIVIMVIGNIVLHYNVHINTPKILLIYFCVYITIKLLCKYFKGEN